MDYQYENGRRYQAFDAEKYHLPNDEQELDRLDLQHHLWLVTLGGHLYEAPISEGIKNALDVGTGTGIWAIEFADSHPECHTIGTDISPTQPTMVPPNCEFLVDDAEGQDWIFPPMDYIHSRMLTIGLKDWPRYFKRCFDALAPGGWIEAQEVGLGFICDDGSCPEDDATIKWSLLCEQALAKIGINSLVMHQFDKYLADCGFTNIVKKEYKWPVGQWMKGGVGISEREIQIGKFTPLNIIEASKSTQALLTRILGWSKEEAEVMTAKVRESLGDQSRHRYGVATIHYAQKPLTEQSTLTAEPVEPSVSQPQKMHGASAGRDGTSPSIEAGGKKKKKEDEEEKEENEDGRSA